MTASCKPTGNQPMIIVDTDELPKVTAKLIVRAFARILATQKRVLFIPSSGRTPIKTYRYLAQHYKNTIDWSRVTIVQMDEYWTKTLDEDAYFYAFLHTYLVKPMEIGRFVSMRKPEKKELFTPTEYVKKLHALGPIDFALHGIGRNGHIGFNEPGSSAKSITRIVPLAAETRVDNFSDVSEDKRPKFGMTMGLKELQSVRHSLLIATGAQKALAMSHLLTQNKIAETPACALFNGPDFGIIMDREAANLNI